MKTITQTAVANLKYNKSRSVLTGIAILLTSCLLMIIFSSGLGIVKHQKSIAGSQYGEYEGAFARITQEQLEKLPNHAMIEKVGYTQSVAAIDFGSARGSLSFIDEMAQNMVYMKLKDGMMPELENEIACQKEFIQQLGGSGKVGDKITVPFRVLGEGEILEKEFVVSGIFESNEKNDIKKAYGGYVSKAFMEQIIPVESRSYTACVKLQKDLNLNGDQMKETLKTIASGLGMEEKNVIENKAYIMWTTDPGTETLTFCIIASFMVILFSCLVIYNIFYVGIIQKVQEFGKLRAIGGTRKQLKGMIFREGMVIAFVSIPIGILIGYLVAKFGLNALLNKFVDGAGQTSVMTEIFSFPVVLLVIVISLLTVYVSLKKPMKIASSVSPVEAMRYQGGGKKDKKIRKGYDYINLFRLTSSNMSRNKKRTITTIFTMGLSCVLFVVVANVASSFQPIDSARKALEKGDFSLEFEYALDDKTYPEKNLNHVQLQNHLGDQMIQKIEAIDGVTKVEKRRLLMAHMQTGGTEGDHNIVIEVLSKEDYNKRDADRMDGVIDYDKAVEQDAVIYSYGNFLESEGFSINGKIDLSVYNGDETIPLEVSIQGTTGSADGTLAMTEDRMSELGIQNDTTGKLFISCEKEAYDQVKTELESMVSNNDSLKLTSIDDELKVAKMGIEMLVGPAYAFLAILGVIGFMNMANTMITSIINRKRELGLLQAMGMTDKQLVKMLQAEGLVLTFGTLVIALTIGNALGYAFFEYAKYSGIMAVTTYHFPAVELLILVVVLLVMQFTLSFVMSRNIQKDALIDRIRFHEEFD